jgi:hypothetical protein
VVEVRLVEVTSPEPPDGDEMYPKVPSPLTVEIREDSRRDVLTKLEKLPEDKYPAVPNPATVD